MHCDIEWNSLTLDEWNNHISQIRRVPLLQSYNYGLAIRSLKGRTPLWGAILIDGQLEGVFQLERARLPLGLFEAVILDMGPLWFNNKNLKEKSRAFFKSLNKTYPQSFKRKRRIFPNLENKPEFQNIPDPSTYKTQGSHYETIWLDLETNENDLRTNLKQKWRNSLHKAEKNKLEFEVDTDAKTYQYFKDLYQKDISQKNYKNIPVKHLDIYKTCFLHDRSFLIFHAKHKGQRIASALILLNVSSATYQIGIINETGRDVCANHFLLWNIALYLKNTGIKDFDLGGINAYDAKSITSFKEGINGQKVTYKGIYS